MKKTKLVGLGNGRGRGRLSAPLPPPPLSSSNLKPLRRSEPSIVRNKSQPKIQIGAEECFQIHQSRPDSLPSTAMTIKLTDKFKEMVQNAKKQGLSARMKFGSTPGSHVIDIGGTEFNFASNTEAAGLCDLFGTNKRKKESSNANEMNLEGNVMRKLSVKRPLDHMESAKWKKKTQETDKSQKLRHVQMVEIKGGPGHPPIKKSKPLPPIRTMDSKTTNRLGDQKSKLVKPPTALLDFSSHASRFSRSKESSVTQIQSQSQSQCQVKDSKDVHSSMANHTKENNSNQMKGMDLKHAVMAAKNVKELRQFLIQLLNQHENGIKLKDIEASAKKEWSLDSIQKTLEQIAVDSKEGFKLLPNIFTDVKKNEMVEQKVKDFEKSKSTPLTLSNPLSTNSPLKKHFPSSAKIESNQIKLNVIEKSNHPSSSALHQQIDSKNDKIKSSQNESKSQNESENKMTNDSYSNMTGKEIEKDYEKKDEDRKMECMEKEKEIRKDDSDSSDGESSKGSDSGEDSESESGSDSGSESGSDCDSDNESNSSEEIDIVDSDADDADVVKSHLKGEKNEELVQVQVDDDDGHHHELDLVNDNASQKPIDDVDVDGDADVYVGVSDGMNLVEEERVTASVPVENVDGDVDVIMGNDIDGNDGKGDKRKDVGNGEEEEEEISIDSPYEEDGAFSQLRKNVGEEIKTIGEENEEKLEMEKEKGEHMDIVDVIEEGEAREECNEERNQSMENRILSEKSPEISPEKPPENNRTAPIPPPKPMQNISKERKMKEFSRHNPSVSEESEDSKHSSKERKEYEKGKGKDHPFLPQASSSWNDDMKTETERSKKEKSMTDCTGKNYGEGDGEDGSHERRSGGGSDDGVESIGSRTNGLDLNEEKNRLNETPPTPVGMTVSKVTWERLSPELPAGRNDDVEMVKMDKVDDGCHEKAEDVHAKEREANLRERNNNSSVRSKSQVNGRENGSFSKEEKGRKGERESFEKREKVRCEKSVNLNKVERKVNDQSIKKEGRRESKEEKKDSFYRMGSSQAMSDLDTEREMKNESKDSKNEQVCAGAGVGRGERGERGDRGNKKRKLDEKGDKNDQINEQQKPSSLLVNDHSNRKKVRKLNEKEERIASNINTSSPHLPLPSSLTEKKENANVSENANDDNGDVSNPSLMDVDASHVDADMAAIESEMSKVDKSELKYFEEDVNALTYFEKYEKKQVFLCNRIFSDYEYKQRVEEHVEKYAVYERIGADLKRIFIHYNMIYEDAKKTKSERAQYILIKNVFNQYAHSYERLKRMKSTYDILEKELESIKFRLKEYMNSSQ